MIYKDLQGFAKNYNVVDLSGLIKIFKGLQGFTRISKDSQGYIRMYKDLQGFILIWNE